MLKLNNNKIHFYDINSGILFFSQSQDNVSVPDIEVDKLNLLSVKSWAVENNLIAKDDRVMMT